MAYTFDNIEARDPNNPALVAANASILITDPANPGVAVTLTDATDLPLANPVTVNAMGYGPAFKHATLDRLAWSGGGFSGFFTSYEGMKAEAVAARQAAETAGQDAAAAASADLAAAVADAEAAQAAADASATAAANSAALVNAPADSAIAAAINGAGTQTKAALSATYLSLVQAAKVPDALIAGAIARDGSGNVTSAAVLWPDGTPGTMTITARHTSGAVTEYNITYGSPVTKTYTQPAITRNTAGEATNVPQIVVS